MGRERDREREGDMEDEREGGGERDVRPVLTSVSELVCDLLAGLGLSGRLERLSVCLCHRSVSTRQLESEPGGESDESLPPYLDKPQSNIISHKTDPCMFLNP